MFLGHGFESKYPILDARFSHISVVKIVTFVYAKVMDLLRRR